MALRRCPLCESGKYIQEFNTCDVLPLNTVVTRCAKMKNKYRNTFLKFPTWNRSISVTPELILLNLRSQ